MEIAENFTKKIFFLLLILPLSLHAQGERCKIRLPETVNRYSRVTSPVISADGRYLFLDRKEHPDNAGGVSDADDIWMAERNSFGSWSELRNLRELNDASSNVLFSISPEGSRALIYNAAQKQHSGFFIARRTRNGWQRLGELRIRNFENTSTNFYGYLNADESVLLLALENRASLGGLDLFVSTREGELSYSEPRNLGALINTKGIEGSPFLAYDNRTLYFFSDGKNGPGKADLYMTRRTGEDWLSLSAPVNLGNVINTAEDENGINLSRLGDTAYVISFDSSAGRSGVYSVCLPDSLRPLNYKILRGKIFGEGLVNLDEALVSVQDLFVDTSNPEDLVKRLIRANRYFVNPENEFLIPLNSERSSRYVVTAKLGALQALPFEFDAASYPEREIFHDIEFRGEQPRDSAVRPVSGKPLAVYHFETNESVASDLERKSLIEQVSGTAGLKTLKLRVAGHTDDVGSDVYNLTLSRRRAESTVRELVKLGIPRRNIRIEAKAYSEPATNEKTPEGRAFNRRVEVFGD